MLIRPYVFSDLAVRYPRIVIAFFVLVLLFCIPGLSKIKFDLSGDNLVANNSDQVSDVNDWFSSTFDVGDEVIVYLECLECENIFNEESLSLLAKLSEALKEHPKIPAEKVYSLATEGRDRRDSFDYTPFTNPIPNTAVQWDEFKEDVSAGRIVYGTMIAKNARAISIIVGLDSVLKREQIKIINAITAESNSDTHRVKILGAQVAQDRLGEHILNDLIYVIPFTILILSFVFWSLFGSVGALVLCFSEVIACLIFTFGLYGYSSDGIYLTTSILPVILMTMGIIDEVHIFTWLRNNSDAEFSVSIKRRSYHKLSIAMTATSLTTAIGFIAFSASSLTSLKAMGVWASVGIVFCLFWSLMFVPAVLSMRALKFSDSAPMYMTVLSGIFSRILERKNNRLVSFFIVAFLCLIALGTTKLNVQDSWLKGFSKSSTFYKDMKNVNENLYGTHVLRIGIEFFSGQHSNLPLHNPDIIELFDEFESMLNIQPTVGGVLGPATHLRAIKFLADGRPHDQTHSIPATELETRQLWRRFELGRGERRRSEVVNNSKTSGVVNIYMGDANYQDTKVLLQKIFDFHESHFALYGAKLHLGGDVYRSQSMIVELVKSQMTSVGLAFVGIFLCFFLYTRSLINSLTLVAPCVIACVLSLGLMGWFNIDLGVATSVFLAICLGVGVDFAIHFFQQSRPDERLLVVYAMSADCLLLLFGFSIFLFSSVPANVHLAMILLSAVCFSALITVFIMSSRLKKA